MHTISAAKLSAVLRICKSISYPIGVPSTKKPISLSTSSLRSVFNSSAANAASIQSYGYTVDFTLFNSSSPVAKHRASVSVPSSASAWYVPSYKEMQLLYENREAVNSTINAVSGNPLHVTQLDYDDVNYQYWCSTFDLDEKVIRAFNMTNGDWFGSKTETTVLPVRVILAF